MTLRFAVALGLGLACAVPASGETYLNPDREWWNTFFKAVDGIQPDFEAMAKKDAAYQGANEFDRAEVLAKLVTELQANLAAVDVPTTEVTISINAKLGDYSVDANGFPVSIFTQNMHLKLYANNLFFRNWQDYTIFPATKDEGKALRARIGMQALAAQVTLGNFQKSTTRPNAYDGFVTKVAYFAADGLPIAEFSAVETAPISADAAADKVATIREKITAAAGIPALGTNWMDAKSVIQQAYPFSASDDFAYTDKGKNIAYSYENGAVVADEAHAADKPFRIYLQQVDGDWRTKRGFSTDLSGLDMVSFQGTGPGLACYTPDVLDRCAVLEFSPAEGGHVLTRAYGVIELSREATVEAALKGFVGGSLDAFETFSTKVDYDTDALKTGLTPKFPGRSGVPAYAAGAGEVRDGKPLYDPLENTSGTKPIAREIALFAVDGAPSRMPMIFVLQ